MPAAAHERMARPRDRAAAIVLASLYGVTDELHQRYVHGRDPDWRDWMADALGSATGAFAAALLLRRRRDAP